MVDNRKNNNPKPAQNDNEAVKFTMKGGDSDKYMHIQPVQCLPLEVQTNGVFDRAFKIFRAIVQREKVLSSYKDHRFYEKPSDKKRRKVNESKRKQMELACENGTCTIHATHKKKKPKKEKKDEQQ